MVQDNAGGAQGGTSGGLTIAPSVEVTTISSPSSEVRPKDPAPGPSPPEAIQGPSAHRRTRRSSVVIVVGFVVLVVVVAVYAFTGGFHAATGPASSAGRVLLPDGASYSILNGQFAGIGFHLNSTATIEGRLNSSEGVVVDIMTPAQFEHLAITLNVSGYEWTSGTVADEAIYNLDVTVAPGQWYLAFLDPNASFPTGVGFYSALTLTPG